MQTDQRHNATLSAAVEHGILLADSQGSAVAWTYMQAYQVPGEAIRRVLAYPETRRKRDAARR
jgi:hypothetical protein